MPASSSETPQGGIRFSRPGATEEMDLSWLDSSLVADLSADGQLVLFTEVGQAGGAEGAVYLRKADGSAPVRLGTGLALALSPDGKWALTMSRTQVSMEVLPTGAGAPVKLKGSFTRYWPEGRWLPDGAHVAVVIAGKGALVSTSDGKTEPLQNVGASDEPIAWSADGRTVYVRRGLEVSRVDVSSGARATWKTLGLSDRAGFSGLYGIAITPNAKAYAYSYGRLLTDLYVVTGLR